MPDVVTMEQSREERLKAYRIKFNKLVVRTSNRLVAKECENLFHIYKDTTSLPGSLRTGAQGEIHAIKLLGRLEQAREFSYTHPEKLVDVFDALDREDLCEEVKTFVQIHEEIIEVARTFISPLPILGTTYGGNPYEQASSQTDLQTDLDGPYRRNKKNDVGVIPTQQVIQDDPYCSFYRNPPDALPQENVNVEQIQSSRDSLSAQQSRQLPRLPTTSKTNELSNRATRKLKQTEIENKENQYTYINPRLLQTAPFLGRQTSPIRISPTPNGHFDISRSSSIEFDRNLGVFSSIGSRSRSDSSDHEPGDSSSMSDSNEEPIYEYPDLCLDNALQTLHPSEPPLLVEEKMRLLVKPIRDMIESSQHRFVTSKPIYARHHCCCNVTFELKITTGAVITVPSSQPCTSDKEGTSREMHMTNTCKYISADLYLQPGSKGLQDVFPLQAYLGIKLPRASLKSKTSRKLKTLQTKLTKPKDKEPIQYLHEQKVLLDAPIDCSPSGGKETLQHVASFPNLMSHGNFMNDKLIMTPFLDLKLVLREFKVNIGVAR